jgi:hypothetical protein
MRTIKEITERHEKAYILLKTTEARRKFVSAALKEGVTFTNGSLPELDKTDDVIVLYNNGIIARLGWAGRVKYNVEKDNTVVVDFEEYIN